MHCSGGPYDEQIELANTFYDEKHAAGQSAGSGALPRADGTVVHIYTQETNIYKGLNGALGGYGKGGRDALPSYYQLIKLLILATRKLPPIAPTTVYRGVQRDHLLLLGGLTVGDRLTWWSFTSTTRSPDVLRNDMFFGIGSKSKVDGTLRRKTKRTVFQIRANGGVDISAYSAVPGESEVVFLPGATFLIVEINEQAFNCWEIKMQQTNSVRYHVGAAGPAAVEEVPEYDTVEDDDYEFESYDTYSSLTSNGPAARGTVLDDAYDMPDGYSGGGVDSGDDLDI